MSTINERFREAREHLELTQTEFATKANRTRSEISNIEYNKTTPKEEVIKAVCAAHNINPGFLRDGELPIILPDIDDETAYINELLSDNDNPLYDIIRAIMKVYTDAPPAEREAIDAFARRFTDKKKSRD